MRAQKYRRPLKVPQTLKAGGAQKFRERPHRQSSCGHGAPRFQAIPGGFIARLLSAQNFAPLRSAKTSDCALPFLAPHPPGIPLVPPWPDKHHPWVLCSSSTDSECSETFAPSLLRGSFRRSGTPAIPKQQARDRPPKPLAALIHLRSSCGPFPKQPNL